MIGADAGRLGANEEVQATQSETDARALRVLATQPLKVAVVVAVAIAGFIALYALSPGGILPALGSALTASGAAAVALLMPRWPVAAVGVVFLVAVFARMGVELPAGTLRPEQPAILALVGATWLYRSRLELPSLRPLAPLLVTAGIYVVVLTISSTFVAEQPLESLRMVAWTAVSMAAGLAAAVLLAGRADRILPWFSGSAAIIGLIGLIGAVGYFLFRVGSPLVAGTEGFDPKVSAFSHEPNLYASLLGATIPIAAEVWRSQPRRRNAAVLCLLLLTIGLGVTRAAYLGLAIGLAVYFFLVSRRTHVGGRLRGMMTTTLGVGLVGLILPVLLMNPLLAGMLTPEGPLLAKYARDGWPAQAQPRNELGTMGFRLGMVQLGLQDTAESPIIGRGAFSFGQRHAEPNGEPAVIAVLPFAIAHDAGLVGLVALSAFGVILLVRLWRAGRDKLLAGPAAALMAALVVLLISYLATAALHFAVTWLITGAAVGATLSRRSSDAPSTGSKQRG